MRADSFISTVAGRLVPTISGAEAFVPAPLARRLSLDAAAANLLDEAAHALGRLDGLGHGGFDPFLVGAPLLNREAIVSSRIEGTIASPEDLALHEAGSPLAEGRKDAEALEVANYVRAMRHGLGRFTELPLSLRLVRELHEQLMQGVRGGDKQPGLFRTSQNYIGTAGSTILNARFVPPPVTEMQASLDDLEKYLHLTPSDDAELPPPLVRVALVHHQFETIHPFADGNGRVGRLLIPLQMIHQGQLRQPVFYMSTYFERHRDEYGDLLLSTCQNGDYLPWVKFFLRGVAECARDSGEQVSRLHHLRQEWRARFQTAGSSALLLELVDRLFARPSLTANEVVQWLGVSHLTASRNIQKLVAAGILAERTGRKRDRVFVAMPLLEFMDTTPEAESFPG